MNLINFTILYFHLVFRKGPLLSEVQVAQIQRHTDTHAHTQLWQIWLDICYDWPDWAISYSRQCWERGGIRTCNNASAIEFQSPTTDSVCVCVYVYCCEHTRMWRHGVRTQQRVLCCSISPSWKRKSSKMPTELVAINEIQFLYVAERCNFRMKWHKLVYNRRLWKVCMHRCVRTAPLKIVLVFFFHYLLPHVRHKIGSKQHRSSKTLFCWEKKLVWNNCEANSH